MSKDSDKHGAVVDGPIDTHVHVFRRGLALVPHHRYRPEGEALPDALLAEMGRVGVSRAVLVQPSFLGTDNGYLLDAMSLHPALRAGIAVVDANASATSLDGLCGAGIVGVRLNCIGDEPPDLARGPHRALADRLAAAGLVLQIQAEGRQWATLGPSLGGLPCRVLVDHFGRTAPNEAGGSFQALLRCASESEQVWFKFSGPYRLTEGAAARCAQLILLAVGTGRIVWGSDWPWTQFEGRHAYADTLDWLASWLPNDIDRRRVLTQNPGRLFGWA